MAHGTLGAGQGAVGAVADEDVPEHELAARRRPEEFAVDEALDGRIQILGKGWVQRGDPIPDEAAAKDRSKLNDAARDWIKRVQTCQHGGLHRVRERLGGSCNRGRITQVNAAFDERSDDLPRIERISL